MTLFLTSCSTPSVVDSNKFREIASINAKSCFNSVRNFFNKEIKTEVRLIREKEAIDLPVIYGDLYHMDNKYVGEDIGEASFAGFKGKKIKYLDKEELEESRVYLTKKGLYQNDQVLKCKRCELIIVIDEYGRMFAGESKSAEFHHSSFLRGEAVASAGSILIEKGIITTISNRSGHYLPDVNGLIRIFESIVANQDHTPQKLALMGPDGNPTYYNVSEIIGRYKAGLTSFPSKVDEEVSNGIVKVLKESGRLD